MNKMIEVLIKDGLIFDGGTQEPYIADIAVSGDRIVRMGKLDRERAVTTIPAKGLAVSPGFIDTHAHSDFTLIADPRAEGKICQGITTEINGNCGMSAAPLYHHAFERREEDLEELGIKERWHTLNEYSNIIEARGIGVNTALLAGHGNIRGSVVGYGEGNPSPSELDAMSDMLTETINQGAIGLSTGLIYPPGIYSETEELIHLSKMLFMRNLIYTSHMRSEGDDLLNALDEVLRIGKETGARVHISHIKTSGQNNWHKINELIPMIEDARTSGIRITCDSYPYIASSTDLDSILPSWTFQGGNDMELRRLRDESEREKISREINKRSLPEDYWEKIVVSSVMSEENRWMEGKTVSEIGRLLNKSSMEAFFKILIDEKLRVSAIFFSMSEDNLRKLLSLPYCMIGSDSSARCFDGPTRKGRPHPRTFGTFPRILGRYVREERLLSLQNAIHKATSLAAETFGLAGRGQIREGMQADIVIFDPGRIQDRATFEDPFLEPDGIYYVLVNGIPAIWDGKVTGQRAGRLLRR